MLTFYQDRFVPEGSRGCCRGFVIFIRPRHKDDYGLLEHERVHRKQFLKRGLVIHSWLYLLVPEYRLACEVEAYKKQSFFYSDDRLPKFAKLIATRYGLKISEADALKLLREDQNG